jgi:pyrroline-5-carboxylate reductase
MRLAAQSAEAPAVLRARVTSPGGTTERALQSLEGNQVKRAIIEAVRAAAERARELGDEYGKD